MRIRRVTTLVMAACFCVPAPVFAADGLMDIYQAALQNDGVIAAARAEKDAGEAAAAQARSMILPSVSLNGSSSRNYMDAPQLNKLPYRYNTDSVTLNITQPVYRKFNFASYTQGEFRLQESGLLFASAGEDLILRTATAFFDVLRAQDVVTVLQAQHSALEEQLTQARHLFEARVGTLTDLHESQARFDQTLAQEIEAGSILDIKQRALQRLVGKRHIALKTLSAFEPGNPVPDDLEYWIEAAALHNLQVALKRNTVDFLSLEIEKVRAGHFPTVDLVASLNRAHDPSYFLSGPQNTNSIALQFNLPLYQGGQITERVREAFSNKSKAEHELEDALRGSELKASESFLAVTAGVAKVGALEQVIRSNESALHSTKMGRDVGLRTSVDVLNAQQQLFSSKLDLSKARYDYLINRLKLKSAIGSLGPDDLAAIDQWMKD